MIGLFAVIDGGGVYGAYFEYATGIFLAGGALVVFIRLWRKGRLDMDESPKYQMFEDGKEDVQDDSKS